MKRPAAIRVGDVVRHHRIRSDMVVVELIPGGRVKLGNGNGAIIARVIDIVPPKQGQGPIEATEHAALSGAFFETIDAVAPAIAEELGHQVERLTQDGEKVIAHCKVRKLAYAPSINYPPNPCVSVGEHHIRFTEADMLAHPGTVEDYITDAFNAVSGF